MWGHEGGVTEEQNISLLCHGWEVDMGFIQPEVEGREVIARGLSRRDRIYPTQG